MPAARYFFIMPHAALPFVSAASSGTSALLAPCLPKLPCAAAAACHVSQSQPVRSIVLHHNPISVRLTHQNIKGGTRVSICAGAASDNSSGSASTSGISSYSSDSSCSSLESDISSSSSVDNDSSSSGSSNPVGSGNHSHSSSNSVSSTGCSSALAGGRSSGCSSTEAVIINSSNCSDDDAVDDDWYGDPDKNPSEEHDKEVLWMNAPDSNADGAFLEQCSATDFANTGKWMLFYHKGILDGAWQRAKQLLQSGQLPGILGIETTTACRSPTADALRFDPAQGVLKFYGGSPEDDAGTCQLGQLIVRKMDYHGAGVGPDVPWGYVYWKSQAVTHQGRYSSHGRVSKFSVAYEPWPRAKVLGEGGMSSAAVAAMLAAEEQTLQEFEGAMRTAVEDYCRSLNYGSSSSSSSSNCGQPDVPADVDAAALAHSRMAAAAAEPTNSVTAVCHSSSVTRTHSEHGATHLTEVAASPALQQRRRPRQQQ
ncbi:hypothetical protein COO60DRAFT_1192470 [Scenedesmus sp. NREL 46B-D3]|nr:hypothetical protein COO60DRAFT_1192470 [Scenedesmus sp. NREL 46B-D3]